MKVIIISEALEEPFEIDSDDPEAYGGLTESAIGFSLTASNKIKAIWEAEQMRKAAVRDRHSIFRHG